MAEVLLERFEGVRRLAALVVVLSLFVACGEDPPAGPSSFTAFAVSSVAPSIATVGVAVTIKGSGFREGVTVTVGGVKAEVLGASSSSITARTPDLPPGRVDIVVTNTNGERATLLGGLTLVLPTYRLTGLVIDATSGTPVPGAIVEVRTVADESAPPVTVAFAGPDGRYRFDGVPSAYFRVTHYGYLAATERVELTADGTRNFAIAPDPGLPDFSYNYTLTIEADAACPSAPRPLPPNLRRRTFPAQVQQGGPRLTVNVGCVAGSAACGLLIGSLFPSGATFSLTAGPDLGFVTGEDLVECITTGSGFDPCQQLVFLGTATTTFSPTGLVGNLNGTMTYYPVTCFPCQRLPSTASCRAGRFELTRR